MTPMLHTMPGFVLCTCTHAQRFHRDRRHECKAEDLAKRYGKPRCGCLRFVEAPFHVQQLGLFGDDGPLLAEFGKHAVQVVAKL